VAQSLFQPAASPSSCRTRARPSASPPISPASPVLRGERGLSPTSEAARAEAELATAEAELARLDSELRAAQRALLVLAGRPTEGLDALPIAANLYDPPATPQAIPSTLLARRPDVREAQARIESAAGGLRRAELALLPTINLRPSLGLSRQESDLFTSATSFWSFGANLLVPILDRPRLLAEIGVNRARAEQAVIATSARSRQPSPKPIAGSSSSRRTGPGSICSRRGRRGRAAPTSPPAPATRPGSRSSGPARRRTRLAGAARGAGPGAHHRAAALGSGFPGSRRRLVARGSSNTVRAGGDEHPGDGTMRSKLAAAGLAAVLAMGLAGCGGGGEQAEAQEAAPADAPRSVRVARVELRPVGAGLTVSGVLVAREEAAIATEVAGYRVARVLAERATT
jgi:hypothetical protein